jgi:nitrogen fixation/metabolism regulation signal transduction histidine kinase
MTIYQYNEQTIDYNKRRFARKENATRLSIKYELDNTIHPLETSELFDYFKEPILEIVKIHKVNINFYDLQGSLLLSSNAIANNDSIYNSSDFLKPYELRKLKIELRFVEGVDIKDDKRLQSSYSSLYNKANVLIGFLKLHYIQNNSVQDKNLNEFLQRLAYVYLLMFVIAISFAYFLSSYITRSLKTIIEKIEKIGKTGLNTRSEKIEMGDTSREIHKLVSAYNNMIDQLEDAAVKLAASEREQAWREMAKQVAHEIKNPLTPMRLTVQSFERRFDPGDPKIKEKLKEYSDSLIQQIDVMSSIATAFSDFAKMPIQRKETVEVISVIKYVLDIFENENIQFESNIEEVSLFLDKGQLIRVVTNLVKNAIQAVEDVENPKILATVKDSALDFQIKVADNGKGIEEDLRTLIFEPRFTTKSSGMGLGLAMSKKIIETYNGAISFESKVGKGTEFTIRIPKE